MTRTTALFSVPSFFRGMSSVLDIGSTLTVYNTSKSPEEADSKAIYSDWAAVGDDILCAFDRWEKESVE
jgi:hypothetical protein